MNPLRRIADSKVLFAPSADGQWVGVFTNRLPKLDHSGAGYISRNLRADRIWVDDVPAPTEEVRPGSVESRQFVDEYYSGTNREEPLFRYVAASKEYSGWDFENQGEPLWFENVEAYSERLVRRRLTSEMVRSGRMWVLWVLMCGVRGILLVGVC